MVAASSSHRAWGLGGADGAGGAGGAGGDIDDEPMVRIAKKATRPRHGRLETPWSFRMVYLSVARDEVLLEVLASAFGLRRARVWRSKPFSNMDRRMCGFGRHFWRIIT